MAFANSSITDLIAAGIENRSPEVADGVTSNNALLTYLKKAKNVKLVDGGTYINQNLSFQQNSNGGFYSGYDPLPVGQSDVLSAAQYSWAQYAVPVVISGLEILQNSGRERMLNLIEERLQVAEATMANDLNVGLYSDGTGFNGKQVKGLDAAIPTTAQASQTDTYGGISRSTWAFWRASTTTGTAISTAATCQAVMNAQWATQVRGSDRPNLILMDQLYWGDYMASLQAIQRFTGADSANLGFPTIKFMDADVVLDPTTGVGTGGGAVTKTAYFLNTKYLFFKSHKDRNFVPLSPNKRYSINQDAETQILAWAGQLTVSNSALQGRNIATTT
jgi:hypothetical protein